MAFRVVMFLFGIAVIIAGIILYPTFMSIVGTANFGWFVAMFPVILGIAMVIFGIKNKDV